MGKLRLTMGMRENLKTLAAKLVVCPDEQKAEEAAYKKAAPLVRRAVVKKFPPKDMAICQKYNAASVDDCIKLKLTSGGIERFDFRSGTGPVVTQKTYSGTIYEADAATTDAVADWVAAHSKLDAAKKAKVNDYRALIVTAKTLEDITTIWPEAEAIRPPKFGALVAISPEVVERIKEDVALRSKKKTVTAKG